LILSRLNRLFGAIKKLENKWKSFRLILNKSKNNNGAKSSNCMCTMAKKNSQAKSQDRTALEQNQTARQTISFKKLHDIADAIVFK